MADELISRQALLKDIEESVRFSARPGEPSAEIRGANKITDRIKAAPAVDAVSRELLEQIKWERNIAMGQLEEHGICFGAIAPDVVKVVRCRDCKHFWSHQDYDSPVCKQRHALVVVTEETFCSYGERKADDG